MKLEIISFINESGKEFFKYELLDGPNNEERVQGYATDLIIAFTKVLEWRERISRDFSQSVDDTNTESP
jgi:HKD family nuclease